MGGIRLCRARRHGTNDRGVRYNSGHAKSQRAAGCRCHPLGLQAVIEKEKTKDYFDFQSQREEVNHSPS
jgi:hypothetical protein